MMRPFSDVDLNAYVDNQVSAERREVITAYLKTAPAEAARIEVWRRQNDAIRAVFAGTATEPVPLWLTIGQITSNRDRAGSPAKIGAVRSVIHPGPLGRQTNHRGLGFWKTMTVAALAFAAGLTVRSNAFPLNGIIAWWAPAAARADAVQGLAKRALDAHTTYSLDSERPAEVSDAISGGLPRWFVRHVAFPVNVPDLQRLGWTLRGGRVVPGDIGPAALLVYENAQGERLSLYMGRVANPSLVDTSYTMTASQILAWMDGPIGFAVVTSRPGSWLATNARDLYRAVYGVSGG